MREPTTSTDECIRAFLRYECEDTRAFSAPCVPASAALPGTHHSALTTRLAVLLIAMQVQGYIYHTRSELLAEPRLLALYDEQFKTTQAFWYETTSSTYALRLLHRDVDAFYRHWKLFVLDCTLKDQPVRWQEFGHQSSS